jgi:YVTN family beta-propeller protein
MEFRILGPMEVFSDGRQVRLGGVKQRALLAVLLLHRNEVVSVDRLIDELWEGHPPATAVKTAQVHVSQLRKTLGSVHKRGDAEEILVTRSPGYVLRVGPDELDSDRFERLVEDGRRALREGDLEHATQSLLEGLSLWRGPALADFALDAFAQTEIARLEEARVSAIEERIDADLAAACHQELIGELEALIRVHPLRERLRGQLMLALYRSDRQAEALAAYQDARRMLDKELGLEPSESLQRLERAILVHDPALDAPARTLTAQAEPTVAVLRPTRRRFVLMAALVAVAIAVTLSVFAFGDDSASTPITGAAGNSVGIVDATSNELVADIPVGATPTRVVVGEGAYWVTNADDHSVSRIDPSTRAVVDTIAVGSSPSGITTGAGAVWVTNSLDGTVSRIDPDTNTEVQTTDVGNFPLGIAYATGSIWVANAGDGTITRIDAGSGVPKKTLPVAATELAVGGGALWASQRVANRVVRIDPNVGKVVQEIPVGNGPTGIAFGNGAVWVVNSLDGTVSRIDPETNAVAAAIPTGNGPTSVAVDDRSAWVSNQFDGTLVRIDPRTNRVARTVTVGNRPQGVSVAAGAALVSVRLSGTEHRGGTLTIRTDKDRPPDSIDTAVASDTTSWPFLRMTGDGLVAFNQVAGVAGTQLVPDLAVSLPTSTDGGKTYTFQLRKGIRYSNGRPVKASDFRWTFERDLQIGHQFTYYDAIVGAARCKSGKRCDLSRGIVTDDAANTVTFHLVEPDPEFLYQLAIGHAYVVPAGTPPHDIGTHPLPATGPYMIASYRPKRVLRLVRNPYFREWSKAAQPDGFPDTIVIEIGGSIDQAIDDVVRGKVDLLSTLWSTVLPSDRLAALRTRHARQVHVNPSQLVAGLFLNTRIAPFDRLEARRALSYGIDRAAAVETQGGPDQAVPTCQILPPDYPGYRPYCPYKAGSTTSGTWTSPDLAQARALVARSGTRGMKITVWDYKGYPGFGPVTVDLLRSLGYRASLKTAGGAYPPRFFDSRVKAQIGWWGWGTFYPAASAWFSPTVTCAAFQPDSRANVNPAQFCDPRIDREIRLAVSEQVTDPVAARRLWERIDREVVDQAPLVPLIVWNVVDVLSKRVGNYQYSGQGQGVLIDQLWVR